MKKLTCLTDADPVNLVEMEWLDRELDIRLESTNPSTQKIPTDSPILILTSRIRNWDSFLKKSPNKSIVLIFCGNEHYMPKHFNNLNNYESLKHVFVQYLKPDALRGYPIWNHLDLLKNRPKSLFERAHFSTLKRALFSSISMQRLRIQPKMDFFPLGYTNRFVGELKLKIPSVKGGSILSQDFRLHRRNDIGIGFYGQHGTWYRRAIIEIMEKLTKIEKTTYGGYGGALPVDKSSYVEFLLRSKTIVCPPGNQSNETPRYYECIALGTLPIVTRGNIQDFSQYDYFP